MGICWRMSAKVYVLLVVFMNQHCSWRLAESQIVIHVDWLSMNEIAGSIRGYRAGTTASRQNVDPSAEKASVPP